MPVSPLPLLLPIIFIVLLVLGARRGKRGFLRAVALVVGITALVALPFFKIHLAFALTALAGLAWQLTSRAVARLRPLHRHTGPYVVLAWCLALLTGIYNYVFLYVMGSP